MSAIETIGVLGAGAWGTALALSAARAGRQVVLWAYEADLVAAMQATRENAAFLPGFTLPEAVTVTGDIAKLGSCDAILAVTPAQHARPSLAKLAAALRPGTPVALCAKGIEKSGLKLMTEVLREEIPQALPAVLSGPSFAKDVAAGLPTAVTLACADKSVGEALVAALTAPTFRLYYSDDLIGAEVGGAVKNVLAIACGISDGMGLGDSARAALITRGFAEMARLGEALGGRRDTLAGLCGLGDLILTCSSAQSRNFSLGRALGQGMSAQDALAGKRSVAEGAETAPALAALAAKLKVDMPISQAVNEILAGALTVADATTALLSRPSRTEG